jgi:hypothetical protein
MYGATWVEGMQDAEGGRISAVRRRVRQATRPGTPGGGNRHMRTRVSVSAAAVALSLAASSPVLAQSVNTLTDAEKKQGWVLLFNGVNFDGWRR